MKKTRVKKGDLVFVQDSYQSLYCIGLIIDNINTSHGLPGKYRVLCRGKLEDVTRHAVRKYSK